MEGDHRAETGATRHGRNIVSRFGSTRARATLAGMVLLLLLAAVAALATRSTRQEQNTSRSMQERAVVVASLANTRGHFYLGTTLLIRRVLRGSLLFHGFLCCNSADGQQRPAAGARGASLAE